MDADDHIILNAIGDVDIVLWDAKWDDLDIGDAHERNLPFFRAIRTDTASPSILDWRGDYIAAPDVIAAFAAMPGR